MLWCCAMLYQKTTLALGNRKLSLACNLIAPALEHLTGQTKEIVQKLKSFVYFKPNISVKHGLPVELSRVYSVVHYTPSIVYSVVLH